MKKLFRKLTLLFFIFSFYTLSYSYRQRVVEDIPWTLEYSINKYGEQDKILGAYTGKWGLREKIYIDNTGIKIGIYRDVQYFSDKIKSISFLFDSKTEFVVNSSNIEELENNSMLLGRLFFIEKTNPIYSKIINLIKKSNKMSILLEDNSGNTFKIVEINNTNASNILKKVV